MNFPKNPVVLAGQFPHLICLQYLWEAVLSCSRPEVFRIMMDKLLRLHKDADDFEGTAILIK